MAHEMGYKISRIFNVCKLRYYSNSVKPKPLPTAKLLESNKPSVKENKNEGNESPENAKQDQPLITSDLDKNDIQLRRRFAKSSTQIALTQPLKLPRLANPFPEPVKSLPSDTVADDEKARLMHEQVKMEARYHLQMQQEKLLQQKMSKMNQEQNSQQNQNMPQNQNVNMCQNQNEMFNQESQQPYGQLQNNIPPKNVKNKQPNFRKPKGYNELENEQNGLKCQTEQNQQDSKFNECNEVINEEETKIKSECASKSRSTKRGSRSSQGRHVRYSRHSRRQAFKQFSTMSSYRRYSTKSPIINPDIIPDTEQADYILARLKTLYPEYKNLKKPVFISGSDEEREFVQYILKLLGKHKQEAQTKKTCAPFPSYSEIKTYVHDQKTNKNNNVLELKNCNVMENNIRQYHTENEKNPASAFLSKPIKKSKKINYNPYNPMKKQPQKQEAPYPAYSDISDEYDESKLLNQWRPDVTLKPKKTYYSTSASSRDLEKRARKKKPPCKSPYPPIPDCDYEETARKNAERNKKQRRCPKNKKSAAPTEENSKVISKIKTWLNSYKIDADKIKIMRSPVNVEGRETYVIEVDEANEVTEKEHAALEEKAVKQLQKAEIKAKPSPKTKVMPFQNIDYKPNEGAPSHVVELSDNQPVTTKNIPGFNSSHEPDAPVLKDTIKMPEPRKIKEEPKYLVPVASKPMELKKIENTEKIKHLLSRKPQLAKINVVKDHFKVKSSKHQPRTNPIIIENDTNIEYNLVDHNSLKENKLVRFKLPKPNKRIVKPNNKYAVPKYTLSEFDYFNKRLDNKCEQGKFERNIIPASCPTVRPQASFAPKSRSDKCKKKEKKPACEEKKKCRYKKKRKLPSCEDVKRKCGPFDITGLDNKNLAAKEFISMSTKSAFGNLKPEDVEMLANESLQKGNTKPFTLKPQFWRK